MRSRNDGNIVELVLRNKNTSHTHGAEERNHNSQTKEGKRSSSSIMWFAEVIHNKS